MLRHKSGYPIRSHEEDVYEEDNAQILFDPN